MGKVRVLLPVCFHSLLPQWLPLPLGPSSGPSSGCGSSFHRQPWLWDVDPATCSHYTSKPRSAGGFPLLLLSRLSQVPAFSFAILPILFLVFLVAQRGKNPPAMQETQIRSLGWEDPLEKGMATHSTILAWRNQWTMVHGVPKSQTRLSSFYSQANVAIIYIVMGITFFFFLHICVSIIPLEYYFN